MIGLKCHQACFCVHRRFLEEHVLIFHFTRYCFIFGATHFSLQIIKGKHEMVFFDREDFDFPTRGI